MSGRLRVVLDTVVASQVQNGTISRETWRRVRRQIRRRFRHSVSPITLIELFNSIEGGSDDHFLSNRDRLEVVRDADDELRILPFPGAFLSRTLYGKDRVDVDLAPEKMEMCLAACLRAQSKDQLRSGVHLPGMLADRRFVLNLS